MAAPIPFNRPCFEGKELVYIARSIEEGHISGDGPFTRKCQQFFEQKIGVKKALLVPSCTDALEMAAILLDLKPGDEVIMPSFTFVSTANAFVLHGAKPVFVDIRPDTLNMDETQLEACIGDFTRAIVPVHYGGVGCEMDTIMAIAEQHGLTVVEDNAHGLFGRYKGRPLGSIGHMATQSFHETKNITCGEGGALLLQEESLIERAEVIRQKGTNRMRFFRGEVDKYTWVDVGSSYVMSDLLAAFLYGQLEAYAHIQEHRARIWQYYRNALKDWAIEKGVTLGTIPPHCDSAWHLYYLLMPTALEQEAFIAHLKKRDILSVFHYHPLHSSDMGARVGRTPNPCTVTEDVSSRLVRLPFYNELTVEDQDRIIEAIHQF